LGEKAVLKKKEILGRWGKQREGWVCQEGKGFPYTAGAAGPKGGGATIVIIANFFSIKNLWEKSLHGQPTKLPPAVYLLKSLLGPGEEPKKERIVRKGGGKGSRFEGEPAKKRRKKPAPGFLEDQ